MSARILLGLAVMCALAFASLADEPKEKETKLKPTAVFQGSHSGIRKEQFAVITAATEWEALWAKHRGDEKTWKFTETDQSFDIDFQTHYLVAIFTGNSEKCWLTLRTRGDEVVLGYAFEIFSTEGRLPDQTDELKEKYQSEAAYTFIILPRPVKTVVIEQDRETRRGHPPEWKERTRFPAPKEKK